MSVDEHSSGKSTRDAQEQRNILKALRDKISKLVEETSKITIENETVIDIIKKEKKEEKQAGFNYFSPINNPIHPENARLDFDVGLFTDKLQPLENVSLESTQKQVLDAISILPDSMSSDAELLRGLIHEQNESLRTFLLRGEYGPGMQDDMKELTTDFVGEFLDKVKQAMSGVPTFEKAPPKSVTQRISDFLSFVMSFGRMILPFSKMLAGGAIFAVFSTSFEYLKSFENTGNSLSKLFESGSISEVGKNIVELFESLGKDLYNSFSWSPKFRELMSTIRDLYDNQLEPAFKYIIDGVLEPFAVEMNHIWTNVLGPKFKAITEYLFQDGENNPIISGLKTLAVFVTDTLIFFFGTFLPPILDTLGEVFVFAIDSIKMFYNFAKEFVPDLARGIMRFVDTLTSGISTLISSMRDLFTAESFTDVLAAVGNIAGTISKMFVELLDNALTLIVEFFNVDETIGLKEGETLLQGSARLINNIIDWVVGKMNAIEDYVENIFIEGYNDLKDFLGIFSFTNIKANVIKLYDTFEEWLKSMNPMGFIKDKIDDYSTKLNEEWDKLVEFIEDINPIQFVKDKIEALVELIKGLIPDAEDIKMAVKDIIKDIPLVGGRLHDLIYGVDPLPLNNNSLSPKDFNERFKEPEKITQKQQELMKTLSEMSTNFAKQPVVINNINNQNAPVSTPAPTTGSKSYGKARTTPTMTPSDRQLYYENGGGW